MHCNTPCYREEIRDAELLQALPHREEFLSVTC
jgi:hypothetical protein